MSSKMVSIESGMPLNEIYKHLSSAGLEQKILASDCSVGINAIKGVQPIATYVHSGGVHGSAFLEIYPSNGSGGVKLRGWADPETYKKIMSEFNLMEE